MRRGMRVLSGALRVSVCCVCVCPVVWGRDLRVGRDVQYVPGGLRLPGMWPDMSDRDLYVYGLLRQGMWGGQLWGKLRYVSCRGELPVGAM